MTTSPSFTCLYRVEVGLLQVHGGGNRQRGGENERGGYLSWLVLPFYFLESPDLSNKYYTLLSTYFHRKGVFTGAQGDLEGIHSCPSSPIDILVVDWNPLVLVENLVFSQQRTAAHLPTVFKTTDLSR